MKKIKQPHNNLFEKVMSVPSEAANFLKNFTEAKFAAGLEYQHLRQIPDGFMAGKTGIQGFQADILYECKWQGKEVYLDILWEHKSYYESPDLQIQGYLNHIYSQQKADWKSKRAAARKNKKTISNQPFQHQLVVPIVFYHGTQIWKNETFVNQFLLPEPWMEKFVPKVHYYLVDLDKITDEFIYQLGPGYLKPMLLVFKHKGEIDFIRHNSDKIFKFVEELADDEFSKEFMIAFIHYIYQTFNLEEDDVQEMIEHIPATKTSSMVQNTWDRLLAKGEAKGIIIGEAKGEAKGIAIGEAKGIAIGEAKGIAIGEAKGILKGATKGEKISEIKKSIDVTLELLKKVPDWDNEDIAEVCKVSEKFVAKVKKTFRQKKKKKVLKFVRKTFAKIPDIKEKDFLKIEKFAIKRWKKTSSNSK